MIVSVGDDANGPSSKDDSRLDNLSSFLCGLILSLLAVLGLGWIIYGIIYVFQEILKILH
jgi:hypothetical protein